MRRRTRQGVGARSLARKTSTLRAMPYKLPTATTHHSAPAMGQKKTRWRYSQRQVTIVIVPIRQCRHIIRAARVRTRTSRAMRTRTVRRLRGKVMGNANVMTAWLMLAGNSIVVVVVVMVECLGCSWSWAKGLLGRPTPKRHVARARSGERKARRMSSEGPAPGLEGYMY